MSFQPENLTPWQRVAAIAALASIATACQITKAPQQTEQPPVGVADDNVQPDVPVRILIPDGPTVVLPKKRASRLYCYCSTSPEIN